MTFLHGFRSAMPALSLATVLISGLMGASSSGAGETANGQNAPLPVERWLTDYGAVGDGRVDDTAALQKAFDEAAGQCLDGAGRTFLISSTLRASRSLCLLNARIAQRPARSLTGKFITGACAKTIDPEAVVDCHDRPVAAGDIAALRAYTQTRTLLIRPTEQSRTLRVHLKDVTIDRGDDPRSGSRTDAAGIWLENVAEALLDGVTITGAGKGYGLMVAHSRNVTIRDLNVHDLVWAPYDGDTPLSLARVRSEGWNRPMVRELRPLRTGVPVFGFGGMRVQEQLVCVMIAGSQKVVLQNAKIKGCRARFAEGDVPWQADGLDIGQDSHDIAIEGPTQIVDTWEGIDVAGGGASNVQIDGASIRDSFAFGIKLGHRLKDVHVRASQVVGAGLAGVVLYGPIDGITLERLHLDLADRTRSLVAEWPGTKAGILIERGGNDIPRGLRLANITVVGGKSCAAGILDRAGARPIVKDLRIAGCTKQYATGD